jgi:hypothetical protein
MTCLAAIISKKVVLFKAIGHFQFIRLHVKSKQKYLVYGQSIKRVVIDKVLKERPYCIDQNGYLAKHEHVHT